MKRGPFKPAPGKVWKTLKRGKPINRRSKRRQSEERIYAIRRTEFLKTHPRCQTRKCCKGDPSQVVSHTKGRGIYYLDEATWKASCWPCENWLTAHSQQAIAEGLSQDRIGNLQPTKTP